MISFLAPIMAVLFGVSIVLLYRKSKPLNLKLFLAFSGAFLLSTTIFELLPEVYSHLETKKIGVFIMGGIFVAETLSVIIQVSSYKMTGRRIFRMAPLHHHYELKGWPEPRIIVRFWIITVILVLIGLASLKIR